jgi:hypothetical protein
MDKQTERAQADTVATHGWAFLETHGVWTNDSKKTTFRSWLKPAAGLRKQRLSTPPCAPSNN